MSEISQLPLGESVRVVRCDDPHELMVTGHHEDLRGNRWVIVEADRGADGLVVRMCAADIVVRTERS